MQRGQWPAAPLVMLSYPKHRMSIHKPEERPKHFSPKMRGCTYSFQPTQITQDLRQTGSAGPFLEDAVSMTRLPQKPYMKLHLRQNMRLLIKEHTFRQCLLWRLCSRGVKIQELHPLEKSNHLSNCLSAVCYINSHKPQFPSCVAEPVSSCTSCRYCFRSPFLSSRVCAISQLYFGIKVPKLKTAVILKLLSIFLHSPINLEFT